MNQIGHHTTTIQIKHQRVFSIDYMNLLASKLGIQVEYISGFSWDEYI